MSSNFFSQIEGDDVNIKTGSFVANFSSTTGLVPITFKYSAVLNKICHLELESPGFDFVPALNVPSSTSIFAQGTPIPDIIIPKEGSTMYLPFAKYDNTNTRSLGVISITAQGLLFIEPSLFGGVEFKDNEEIEAPGNTDSYCMAYSLK